MHPKRGSLKTHLIRGVGKDLSSIFGEVIGSVLICGDLFDPGDDLARNWASRGRQADARIDGWLHGGVMVRGGRETGSGRGASAVTCLTSANAGADSWARVEDLSVGQGLGLLHVLHGFHDWRISMGNCEVLGGDVAVLVT